MRSSRVLQTPVVIAFIMRIIYARRLRSAHTDGFDDLVLDKVEKETWRQAKRAVKAKHHHKYHHGARRWHKTVPADEHEKEGKAKSQVGKRPLPKPLHGELLDLMQSQRHQEKQVP